MASKKTESFETLYRKLEETVAALEEGGLTLDESIALYEGGVKLARRCQEFLQQAELRVTKLQETLSDSPTLLRDEAIEYGSDIEAAVTQDAPPLE